MGAIGPGTAHNLNVDVGQRLGISVGSLSPAARDEIAELLGEIADAVEDLIYGGDWPVDTGRSLRAWSIMVDEDDLRLEVQNPVFYASFVHPKGTRAVSGYDELGHSGKQIEAVIDQQWAQRLSRIRRAAQGGAAGPGVETLGFGAGDFFQSLRSIYTMGRIADR